MVVPAGNSPYGPSPSSKDKTTTPQLSSAWISGYSTVVTQASPDMETVRSAILLKIGGKSSVMVTFAVQEEEFPKLSVAVTSIS